MVLLTKEETIKHTEGLLKGIKCIGDDSYATFFLHCFWIQVLGMLLKRISITLPWLLTAMLYLIFVVAICEITVRVVRSIAEKIGCKKYLKYIGFER